MKRVLCCVLLTVLLTAMLPTVSISAQTALTYVTDFEYAQIKAGGVGDTFVYTAYADEGYMTGALTANGEQSRELWSAASWSALFEAEILKTTVLGDAGALCPYADKHGDVTVCPYLDISLVTITNTQTGVTFEEQYIPQTAPTALPGSSVHFCFGRYGFVSPVTFRWDGESRAAALRDANGKWGVCDIGTGDMLTGFAYEDMSAVYGEYVKVFNGTAWGRLDLSGTYPTEYRYASEEEFSVTEELRQIADGQWQVFNADNEPISTVFEYTAEELSYAAGAHMLLVTAEDGTKRLCDLTGTVIAQFEATQEVLYLEGACYAIENYNANGAVTGVALARVDSAVQPEDTIVKGDVDLDGKIDSNDARLILLSTVDARLLTARQTAAADLNEDAIIDSIDARALIRMLL